MRGRPRKTRNLQYRITLQANGAEYRSEGNTMLEALTELPISYNELKTKGTLIIEKGTKRLERFMYFMPLRQMLAGKFKKQLHAKNFEYLLNAQP